MTTLALTDFQYQVYILRYFLLAGPIIGAICGILSVYVVLRRMALISEGISHAGFGGFAVAILLGYYVRALDNLVIYEIVAGIFCVITAILIGYVTRKKRVSEDSAIGIFLVATVATGLVLLQFRSHLGNKGGRVASAQTVELLFGSSIGVSGSDVLVLCVTLAMVAAVIGSLYYQFLYTTLDEGMARVNGVNTRLVNLLLLVMISLVIVISIRMVGSLMITALMVIPGATANMLSRRFGFVMIASILIGTLGSTAASALALIPPFDTYDPGPTLVLVLFALFALVWGVRQFKRKPRSPDALPTHDPAKTERPGTFGGHSH